MIKREKIKKLLRWQLKRINLKDKYRLGLYNDTTYEQVLHFRLTGKGVLIALAVSVVLLIAFTTVLIAFTPIRELIPGYPNSKTRQYIQANALKADSLESVINAWSHYMDNTLRVVSGENPKIAQSTPDSSLQNKPIQYAPSLEDSLLRAEVEREEQFNLTVGSSDLKPKGLAGLHFFPPVKGSVKTHFDPKVNYLGIDIATGPNEVVVSALDGTVIMANWTIETDNVIQIQHDDNLISIYKHNAKLLQKQGNRVKAGDAIAIVGTDNGSGPHLYFELWNKGTPINPEQYIIF